MEALNYNINVLNSQKANSFLNQFVLKARIKQILISILVLAGFSNYSFAQEVLSPELLWKLGRVGEVDVSPDKSNVLYGVTTYDVGENKGNTDFYVLNLKENKVLKVIDTKTSEFNAIFTPDGKNIAYAAPDDGGNYQIWLMDIDGNNKKQISKIPGGIGGFSFSPDMKNILFIKEVKMKKSVNELHPDLPKANAIIADDLMYRHWNDWEDEYFSHLCVAPYINGSIGRFKDIMANEPYDTPLKPYGGMNEIAWSSDSKTIAYTCKKLKGKEFALSTNSDIYLYDIQSQQTKNLSEGMNGYDKEPVFSPNGKKLVWWSMKTPSYESDKQRIMIYDLEKKSIDDYSLTFDQSSSNFVWDKEGKMLYFISGIEGTHQIYELEIENKKIRKITEGDHDYTAIYYANDYLVAAKMSISLPTELFRVKISSGKEEQLSFVNKDVLANVTLGKVEKRWITTSDNKKMLTWVIYPPNFDSNKQYPALLYCQGGPQSMVSQFFSYRWNFQIMAANDYIVVAPNRRGLPGFGQEWNDQIAGDYGGQNMNDYLSAIDSLSKENFIDENRLGAVGASYGGYSVFWLAGNHQNRFKAFIAHCGMFNFESWYASTEEMFFPNHDFGGAFWDNPTPKSYEYSPHKYVNNWNTPIMVIHGGKDFRIPYTQGMQAFNIAQLKGIPSKFLFFPEESHFVLKPQNSILWQREFFAWLDKWLK